MRGSELGESGVKKSVDERKELLARAIHLRVSSGYRIESQGDFQAVLVRGHRVNHVLHLIITLVTCFLWSIVWITLVISGGEKRVIVSVDEWGNTLVSPVRGSSF